MVQDLRRFPEIDLQSLQLLNYIGDLSRVQLGLQLTILENVKNRLQEKE